MPQDPIDQLTEELNPKSNDPVQEAADAMVHEYAPFLAALLTCSSMGEVDALATEHPKCVKLNHRVQYLLHLYRKGLVELATDKVVFASLNHPIAKYISEAESRKLLAGTQYKSLDDVLEDAIIMIAATTVVGGVFAHADVEWMETTNLNLVPDIKRTLH